MATGRVRFCGQARDRRQRRDPGAIRAEDTEPYIALQYVARLFKIVAMIVIVAIIAEVVAGLIYEGMGAGFNLLAEVIQGGVLAAMLWGAGDLTLLFIDVGHDVRAARVLLGRMSTRMNATEMGGARVRSGPSMSRVAGPVSFLADVAIFQIVPSGARTTPPTP